jgi:8-oxo-dGTP pyrophosphatase MutT (NUDIX family)
MSSGEIFYVINVEAVVTDGERYLMTVRSQQEEHAAGALALPGGKVERAGINPRILEETACREVLEETGIEVDPNPVYLWSSSFVADNSWPVVDVVFLCRYRSGEPVARQPEEISEVHWMTSEEIFATPGLPPWTRRSLEEAERRKADR